MGKDFSPLGRALAAPARSVFLDLLMDGSRRPAGELAAAARIGASTASEHLAVLVDSGLVVCEAHGRQRFYAIADPAVAAALEALGGLCPQTETSSLRQSREARALAGARLCYDHLAGHLGVGLTEALVGAGWLGDDLVPPPAAAPSFATLGIDLDRLRRGRRPLTRACPDWTERRSHLAGALGAALAQHFLAEGWVRRQPTGRGLAVTEDGRAALHQWWGLEMSEYGSVSPLVQ
jgi:DNA-binding transcriptional ArsR family regulator